jgi:hypothetical protein
MRAISTFRFSAIEHDSIEVREMGDAYFAFTDGPPKPQNWRTGAIISKYPGIIVDNGKQRYLGLLQSLSLDAALR